MERFGTAYRTIVRCWRQYVNITSAALSGFRRGQFFRSAGATCCRGACISGINASHYAPSRRVHQSR
ncbi:hypothetical protein KCP70_09565 [Salmonella enterica subsp. enterica]|nr:hypothetical protein KCP70_09565 [Salmonella enterica subsp. enterica]